MSKDKVKALEANTLHGFSAIRIANASTYGAHPEPTTETEDVPSKSEELDDDDAEMRHELQDLFELVEAPRVSNQAGEGGEEEDEDSGLDEDYDDRDYYDDDDYGDDDFDDDDEDDDDY